MYKRKNKANIITHKEFVSFVGNVDTFRILLFAKNESNHWNEIEKIVTSHL